MVCERGCYGRLSIAIEIAAENTVVERPCAESVGATRIAYIELMVLGANRV